VDNQWEPVEKEDVMDTEIETEAMTIVDAVTTRGAKVTLASDPEGCYFLSEQRAFQGGVTLIVAHKIGPVDKVREGTARYSVLNG
jgi:hypothetical protein